MTSTNAPSAPVPAVTQEPVRLEPVPAPPRCLAFTDEQIERLTPQELISLRDEATAAIEAILRKKEVVDMALERMKQQVRHKIEMEEAEAKRLADEAAAHARTAAAGREWLAKVG